jgi:hypothetical protein
VNLNRFSQKIEGSKLLGAIQIAPPKEALLNEWGWRDSHEISWIRKEEDTQEYSARIDNLYMTKSSWFLVVDLTLLFIEYKHQLPSLFQEVLMQEN